MLLTSLLATLALTPRPPIAAGLAAADSTPLPACEAVAATVARPAQASDLAAALGTHGGAVRWVVDRAPLTVWLQERPRDGGRTHQSPAAWRAALGDGITAWDAIVPGMRVVIARDSASAAVRVVWAATLATAANDPAAGALASLTAGRTALTPDASGRAVAATIVLAMTAPNGLPYQPADARAVVRHEMGHALGLAHHASPRSVMAPLVTAERIGDDDRAVLRALYALPVGAACALR